MCQILAKEPLTIFSPQPRMNLSIVCFKDVYVFFTPCSTNNPIDHVQFFIGDTEAVIPHDAQMCAIECQFTTTYCTDNKALHTYYKVSNNVLVSPHSPSVQKSNQESDVRVQQCAVRQVTSTHEQYCILLRSAKVEEFDRICKKQTQSRIPTF